MARSNSEWHRKHGLKLPGFNSNLHVLFSSEKLRRFNLGFKKFKNRRPNLKLKDNSDHHSIIV